MDNASWENVHGYIVWDWCRIPLLLNVQQVFFGFEVDSQILLIMNSLMTQGDLKQKDIALKLVCFGIDGVNTFQGLRSGVSVQIQW